MFQYNFLTKTIKMFDYNLNNYTKTILAKLVILLYIQIKIHKNYTSEPSDTVAISQHLCQVPSTVNQNTL